MFQVPNSIGGQAPGKYCFHSLLTEQAQDVRKGTYVIVGNSLFAFLCELLIFLQKEQIALSLFLKG